jgi:hypothetical protein
MMDFTALDAIRRQATHLHRAQLAALRTAAQAGLNRGYPAATYSAAAADFARNSVLHTLANYGPRPADTFRQAFAATAALPDYSRTLAAQMTPLLDLSRQQADRLRSVQGFRGPDLGAVIPGLGAWYRDFGDQITRIADNILPANLRPFGDDDWAVIFEISAEDAMALAWAPRTTTVQALLAAPDRTARLAVLDERRESVLQDLDTGFGQLSHPALLELGELGRHAVAAARADMPQAALALCASLLETAMKSHGLPWLLQEYPELFPSDKVGIGRALSQTWTKAPGVGARAFSYVRWLVIAGLQDSFQYEGAARDRFNRHRIVHQASRASYKPEYTLPALLNVHALLHLIEWHVDLPDQDLVDPEELGNGPRTVSDP